MEAACAAPLDKLENAHEVGRQLAESGQAQRDEVQQQLTTVEADQFGIAALKQAAATLDAKSTQAQQLLVSDPLGAPESGSLSQALILEEAQDDIKVPVLRKFRV